MNPLIRFLIRPWSGVRQARTELQRSERDRPHVRELGDELRRIERENHITARIHYGMRGGKE